MLRYDSTHGRFAGTVEVVDAGHLRINGDDIALFHEADTRSLSWAAADRFGAGVQRANYLARTSAAAFGCGCQARVDFNPADSAVDNTIIYGLNHLSLTPKQRIVSNGSCSTNCLLPILAVLDKAFGIEAGNDHHSFRDERPTQLMLITAICATPARQGKSIIPVNTGLHIVWRG